MGIRIANGGHGIDVPVATVEVGEVGKADLDAGKVKLVKMPGQAKPMYFAGALLETALKNGGKIVEHVGGAAARA
jgi:hypothetical protein